MAESKSSLANGRFAAHLENPAPRNRASISLSERNHNYAQTGFYKGVERAGLTLSCSNVIGLQTLARILFFPRTDDPYPAIDEICNIPCCESGPARMGNSRDLAIELTDGATQASPLRGNCCERARRCAVEG